jgi:hypothetical protein
MFRSRFQALESKMFNFGLAFDGGSNHSAITKEYDARKKLKKVGFTVPVIGFGSPEDEMEVLYEVPL